MVDVALVFARHYMTFTNLWDLKKKRLVDESKSESASEHNENGDKKKKKKTKKSKKDKNRHLETPGCSHDDDDTAENSEERSSGETSKRKRDSSEEGLEEERAETSSGKKKRKKSSREDDVENGEAPSTQTAVYREGALRLAGSGSSANQGRVEVYANKQWGTVCDDYWGQNDANVVCRQLGFIGASGFKRKAETFGVGTGAILLDNVNCVGNEASIMDCPMNDIGDEDCTHSEDAGVICRVPVRLAGSGSSANQGRVEVYAEGQWGTVCDDHWGQEDANVVCRQLGFPGASDFTRMAETFGEGTGAILLDNVNCVGNEASIVDCRMNDIGDEDCTHSEDAGVICRGESSKSPNKI
eukprot:XP_011671007.1 PREDICTED: neurotrypsin-like [Strongylocentrotus purpuratus]